MRGCADPVYRCATVYNELIGRIGVKGSLAATAGFDSGPSGRDRRRSAAQSCWRIPLRLTATATRRLRPYRATSGCLDSHGAGQRGHGHADETQPDRQNGCQPTHNPFRPPRPCCIDARPQGKFRQHCILVRSRQPCPCTRSHLRTLLSPPLPVIVQVWSNSGAAPFSHRGALRLPACHPSTRGTHRTVETDLKGPPSR